MSWSLLARQYLRESIRSREFPGYVGVFGVLFALLGLLYARVLAGGGGSTTDFLTLPILLSIVLVPTIGLLLGQGLVAERREDGRLRLVLGQPVSRTDLVVGGYVAAAVVLLTTLAVAGAATVAVIVVSGAPFAVALFARFVLLAMGLGLAYLGIGVAISATLRTASATTLATFATFLVFVVFWRFAPTGAAYVANGFRPPATSPPWADLVGGVSPSVAFEYLVDAFFDVEGVPSGPDHYENPLIYLFVLLWWAVVVPWLAVRRFNATDL